MSQRLLDIRGLKTHFKTDDGWLHAVDGVDLFIAAGETLELLMLWSDTSRKLSFVIKMR